LEVARSVLPIPKQRNSGRWPSYKHGCLGARVLQAGSEGARSVALPVDETPRSRRLHRLPVGRPRARRIRWRARPPEECSHACPRRASASATSTAVARVRARPARGGRRRVHGGTVPARRQGAEHRRRDGADGARRVDRLPAERSGSGFRGISRSVARCKPQRVERRGRTNRRTSPRAG
jgi:hypothetical protein